ncbi:MAG: hemin uptake protein HemP [Acetobacteraceae bacterium]
MMNQTSHGGPDVNPGTFDGAALDPPSISSSDLLCGGRELLIQHGENTYRLKLTGSNKLILTK